eukprot:295437_1
MNSVSEQISQILDGLNERQDELRIVLKIIDNILTHPTDPKYQSIKLSALSKKLSNIEVWIQLLLTSGFNKSNNRLIFDPIKKQQLSYLNNILSQNTIESNKSQNVTHKTLVCDNISVESCEYLDMLITILNKYNSFNIDGIDMLMTINCYIHLLCNKHDNDNDFDFIFNKMKLSTHDIRQCDAYKRNTRDRSCTNENYIKLNASIQILDKIHCYFIHSYDIGQRLTINEREAIMNDTKVDNDETNINITFFNQDILKLQKTLNAKSSKYKDCISRSEKRNNSKCNQILPINEEKDTMQNRYNMYCFGTPFCYDYKGETNTNNAINTIDMCPHITPKYVSLKQELISNNIAALTMDQFNNEYRKTLLHYQSLYCKQTFTPYEEYSVFDKTLLATWKANVDFILSLMVYCNYTAVQYEYSKNCRNTPLNMGRIMKNEEEFCHLGKYLKMVIHKFGTKICDGAVKTFYHGVSELLMFPECVGLLNRVNIHVPLSTTSAIEVALNFTNDNNGMVLELSGGDGYEGAKYFSMSWLSDFANEKEYFFVQNGTQLQIENILDVGSGYEYFWIIEAVRIINILTTQQVTRIESIDIPLNIQTLIVKIIHHQLSLEIFSSLSEYAQEIIKIYFEKRENTVYINYSLLRQKCFPLCFNEFCLSDCEWIQEKKLVQLFPNSISVYVWNIELDDLIFTSMLNSLRDASKLESFHIRTTDHKASSMVDKYKDCFGKIDCELYMPYTVTKQKQLIIRRNKC